MSVKEILHYLQFKCVLEYAKLLVTVCYAPKLRVREPRLSPYLYDYERIMHVGELPPINGMWKTGESAGSLRNLSIYQKQSYPMTLVV